MRRPPAGAREEGSSLVLVMIVLVVVLGLVGAFLGTSVGDSKATTENLDRASAWFAAHSGTWAAANDLSTPRNGAGNLSGSTAQGTYTADQTTSVGGATLTTTDGWLAFSTVAEFLEAENGYFEGRAKLIAGGVLIRARGKHGTSVKTLESFAPGAPSGGTSSPFSRGAFGDIELLLDSNVVTDSYHSDDDTWEDHATSTTQNGNPIKNQNGGIASNGDITLASNTHVYGDANPGPSGNVYINNSNVSVSGNTTSLSEAELHAPPVWTVPTTGLSNFAGVSPGGDFYKKKQTATVGPGTYVLNSLWLDGSATLQFVGNAGDLIEIYITGGDSPNAGPSFMLDSNSRLEIDGHTKDSGPTVKVYNVGKFEVNSNAELAANYQGNPSQRWSGDPIQFQYFSDYASSADDDYGVHFNSNNNTSAVIYAPDAVTSFDSNSQYWGAIVSDKIFFNSNMFLHYDESLGAAQSEQSTPETLYVPGMIRELR